MILRSGTFIKKKYIPLLLSSFLAYLFCIVSEFIDTTIGANMISEGVKVADAIEIVSPIYQIIVFVGGLVSIGCATLYFHYIGKYQDKKAHQVFGQSIIVSLIIGLAMMAIMYFCKWPFLKFFGCTPEVEQLAGDYYNWYILIAFLYPQYWLLYYLVHNDADEKVSFLSDGLQLGVHVLCSILLVKFTNLGINALSLGTFIGLAVSYISLFLHFLKKKNAIKPAWGFDVKDLGRTVVLGASTSFTYLFVAIVDITMNKFIVARFGDDYLACYSVANLLLNLATVYLNLGESANPFNCVYYGEENNKGIRKVMKMGHRYAFIEGAFFTICFIAFATLFPRIFNIPAGPIYDEATFICYIISITMIPTALLFLYISYYPSIKKEQYSFILSVCYMLVFPLALAIPLALGIGFKGISIGLMLVPIASFIVLFIILLINKEFKLFPLLLRKDKYEVNDFDIKVNKDNINEVIKKSNAYLKSKNINKKTLSDIDNLLKETYNVIYINNPHNNHLYSEIDLMVNDKEIDVVIRDNGTIFDITKIDNKHKFTKQYKTIISKIKDKTYLTTTSFNRTCFVFNR